MYIIDASFSQVIYRQILRLSFLGIMLFTLIFGIIFFIKDIIPCFKGISDVNKFTPFYLFIIGAFVISYILFIATTYLSSNFGKRFIREVGYTYEALRLDL